MRSDPRLCTVAGKSTADHLATCAYTSSGACTSKLFVIEDLPPITRAMTGLLSKTVISPFNPSTGPSA
jgi:hypothetical protein